MDQKNNVGGIILAVIITAILVGSGVYFWQNKQAETVQETAKQEDEKPATTTTESVEQTTFIEQIPLFCPPSGETVKSRLSNLSKQSPIELYLNCGDGAGFSSTHLFFTELTSSTEEREKVLYYSLNNQQLEWQFGDNNVQTLSTKPGTPWDSFDGFGGDNPVEILDLTLNGKELGILSSPIKYDDGGLGGFQGAEFELSSFSQGTLTLGDRIFTIDLENNTIKETN